MAAILSRPQWVKECIAHQILYPCQIEYNNKILFKIYLSNRNIDFQLVNKLRKDKHIYPYIADFLFNKTSVLGMF